MKKNKWTECGLNADWCVQAWHYGMNRPNCVDGDFYVIDNEEGMFEVYRYYPSREEETNDLICAWPRKRDAMTFVERLTKQSVVKLFKEAL